MDTGRYLSRREANNRNGVIDRKPFLSSPSVYGPLPFSFTSRFSNSDAGDQSLLYSNPTSCNLRCLSSFEENDDVTLRVMSVVEEGSTMSLCCYNEEKNEIITETRTAARYEIECFVENFVQVTRPNMVLIGKHIANNMALLDMVTRQPANLSMDGKDPEQPIMCPSQTSIPYHLLSSRTFDVQVCKRLILQKLRVHSMKKNAPTRVVRSGRHRFSGDSESSSSKVVGQETTVLHPSRFHYLAAVINFDSKVLVQALGALLSYLQKTIFQLQDGNKVIVDRIIEAKTSDFMVVSPSAFSALHIFSVEKHPLIAKGHGNSKEGFSLYSLLDRTKSTGGRQLLREWMLRPLTDLDAICTRQDVIEFFLQPALQTTFGLILDLLGKVGAIDKILLRIQKCTVKPNDFLVLTTTLSAATSISNIIRDDLMARKETAQPSTFVTERCMRFFADTYLLCNVQVIVDLLERIMAVIDRDLTLESKGSSVVIRKGFHEELDRWKNQYECLEEIMATSAKELYNRHCHLDGLMVVFIPQVGYLVVLRNDLILHNCATIPPDFEEIFNQDGEVFFKCKEMRELDDEVGDLDGLIKDKERMIVAELEEYILDTENELRECFIALSTLDCILSFVHSAADMNCKRPKMIDNRQYAHIVDIQGGRHPLQEIVCEGKFVNNDTHLDETNRTLCITGPNCSGKSCYMRQVGLLVYMAHLGCFIPCYQATISITRHIFAHVSTIETCTRPQSSYQLELTEMASILLKASPRALVLIDEFGKGTNPASGMAILGAALKKLSKIKCKIVCTTHFLELFTMKIIADGREGIKGHQMILNVTESRENVAKSLFKVGDGVASSSVGLFCARRAGISKTVIKRAEEIIRTMRARKPIRPLPEATKEIPTFSRLEKGIFIQFLSALSWKSTPIDSVKSLLQLLSELDPQLYS